jgi:two-component system chemotaxis response regulator CheY
VARGIRSSYITSGALGRPQRESDSAGRVRRSRVSRSWRLSASRRVLSDYVCRLPTVSLRTVEERLSTMMSWSILLVDDSDTFRAPIRAALTAKGVRVIEAENGKLGLIRARTEHVDLIFTDVHMPVMDGLQMVRELRTLREYASTPIFVLTSDASGNRAAEGKIAGATGWIVKPVHPDVLWKIAEKTLFGVPVRQVALASTVSGEAGRSGQK